MVAGSTDNNWKYGVKGDYILTLIGERFGLWKGISANVHAETRVGKDVDALTGISPANANMSYPAPGHTSTEITQFLLTQELGKGFALSAGKFNSFDLFELAFHSGRGIDGFMNTSMVIPFSMARIIPASFMGAALLKFKGKEVQGAVAVYDPNNSSTTSGYNTPLFDDFAAVGVWKFFHDSKNDKRPGYVGFGANWSNRKYTTIEPTSLAVIPGSGLTLTNKSTSWNVFSLVEHQL